MKGDSEKQARVAFILFLLLGALITLAWYLVVSSQKNTYQIVTHENVSGLIVDAPVEFHGVEVGKVEEIELTNSRSVRIVFSVAEQAPINQATVATITARGLATRGFTGYVYIALENSGTNSQPLPKPAANQLPEIATAPSRSMSMDTTLNQLNSKVEFITALLRSLLDPATITSLKRSIDNLQQVSRTLASNNEKLGSIIAEAEQASGQLTPLLENGNRTVQVMQTQILPEAYKALTNLNALATSLGVAADKISQDPSILIRGSIPVRPGPGETR